MSQIKSLKASSLVKNTRITFSLIVTKIIPLTKGKEINMSRRNSKRTSFIKRKFKRTSNRKLSIHDIQVLDFLWTWKVANFAMLVQVGYSKKSSWWAYKAIRQLQKEKYIQALPRGKYLDHEVFALTNLGFEVVLMDRDDIVEYRYRPHAPAHDYFATCLQLGDLWQSHWDKVFFTEQMLASLRRSNFPKDYVRDEGHVPDGITTLSCGLKQMTFGLEVDLNLKDRERYRDTFGYYESLPDIQYVFWLIRNDWMFEKILQMHSEFYFRRELSAFLFIRLDDFKKDFWNAKIIHGKFKGHSICKVYENAMQSLGKTNASLGQNTSRAIFFKTTKSPQISTRSESDNETKIL